MQSCNKRVTMVSGLGRQVLRLTATGALLFLVTILLEKRLYCLQECNELMWTSSMSEINVEIFRYIQRHVLDPPQDAPPRPLTPQEVKEPVFKDFGAWKTVMSLIMMHAEAMGRGLTFVEIGSGDGEFLSFTSQLEVLLGWQGLLIEPREDAYKRARERRRAAGANVCVSVQLHHTKDYLWEPKNNYVFGLTRKLNEGSTTLIQFVTEEDRSEGTVTSMQCFTVGLLMRAYLATLRRPSRVDVLVVDTPHGVLEILDSLDQIRVQMMLLRLSVEYNLASALKSAKAVNMRLMPQNYTQDFMIFLHNDIEVRYASKP